MLNAGYSFVILVISHNFGLNGETLVLIATVPGHFIPVYLS